jgi:hypothetical protein
MQGQYTLLNVSYFKAIWCCTEPRLSSVFLTWAWSWTDLLLPVAAWFERSALVSIYQTDVTSFSIKYKSFENEPNPEPNPNQIEGENQLRKCGKLHNVSLVDGNKWKPIWKYVLVYMILSIFFNAFSFVCTAASLNVNSVLARVPYVTHAMCVPSPFALKGKRKVVKHLNWITNSILKFTVSFHPNLTHTFHLSCVHGQTGTP